MSALTLQAIQAHDSSFSNETHAAPYESSASSISSKMSSEHENATEAVNSSLWRVKLPRRWAENRLIQITEALTVFKENGFITADCVNRAADWASKMLAVVLSDTKACEQKAMASSSYWTIHLCQIAFSKRELGDGYKICSRTQDGLDSALECWSMENMHKLLSGEKSKSFRDDSKGGVYETSISSQAARKHRIGSWTMRSDMATKRLDIRPLGDGFQQSKKSSAFFDIWTQAGLPNVDQRIVNRDPPDTHLFSNSGSALNKKSVELLNKNANLLAMKSVKRGLHATKRSSMGAVHGSGVARSLFSNNPMNLKKRSTLSMGSCERSRQTSRMHDDISDSDDDAHGDQCANGVPIQKPASKVVNRDAALDTDESAVFGIVELPSDDEPDVDREKEDLLRSILESSKCPTNQAAPPLVEGIVACDPETRHASSPPSENGDSGGGGACLAVDRVLETVSSDEEDEEEVNLEEESSDGEESSDDEDPADDEGAEGEEDGPREEGGITESPEDFHSKYKSMSALSMNDLDRDKLETALEARAPQSRGDKLTRKQLNALDWFSRIDLAALKEGELRVPRRARKMSVEQIAKKKRLEAEKARRAERTAKIRALREEVYELFKVEQDDRRRTHLQARLDALAHKEQRARERHVARCKRVNARLNDFIRRQREKTKKSTERYRADAERKVSNAKKRKLSSIVRTGDMKLTILHRPPPAPEPIQEEELIASSFADVYRVEQRLAKRLKNGASVPMPLLTGSDGSLRVSVKARAGKKNGTRAAAAAAGKAAAAAAAELAAAELAAANVCV